MFGAVSDYSGGHVLKKLGDGLMALFGYPQAQENDAERAVRAALAIQRALAELNARNARSGAPQLSARIGLECGSVVVDAAGEVFGEAPNVAARVQAAAEPGTVLVTTSVQRQTVGLFVAEDRDLHDLKGVLEPVTLYCIVRASGAGRRRSARADTPRRARGRARSSQPALGAGAQGRGSACAHRRRAGLGQVAADRRVSRPPRRDSAHLGRVVVVATAAEYAAAPRGRMGTAALWRRRHARRSATRRSREYSAADRSGRGRICAAAGAAVRRPAACGPRGEIRAGGIATLATVSDDGRVPGRRPIAADRARLRGPALGRSDLARSVAGVGGARCPGAAPHRRDDPAGIPPGLEPALAPQRHFARAARPRARAAHGGRDCREVMPCPPTWSTASASAPAACRFSSRR